MVILALIVTGACDDDDDGNTDAPPESKGPIVVGSKIDTEGALLASMMILTLEANGFKVTDKSQTGATAIVKAALENGEIDMYPEYTGNGAFFFDEAFLDEAIDEIVQVVFTPGQQFQVAEVESLTHDRGDGENVAHVIGKPPDALLHRLLDGGR